MTAGTAKSGPGALHIGTSGWAYRGWKEHLYKGVPQRCWLVRYAEVFRAVEVNATFYRLMKPETLARWHDETPDDFVFTAKGHRVVTHTRKLRDVGDAIRRSRDNMGPLAGKLRVVLWQLPAKLVKDLDVLKAFGADIREWPTVRHVLEFRDDTWFDDEVRAVLDEAGLGTCVSDSPRWPRWDATTAGIGYARLHGHERLYASCYGAEGLRHWTMVVRGWLDAGLDVHVYFDNDAEGFAPSDAQCLATMLGEDGKAA
ncbi:MAG: DUF72 domain-containing protein [Rhodospirillales bacterium]|nr:MAG: DUF72 domain-containing protein [Rhodospirillales bacterium]